MYTSKRLRMSLATLAALAVALFVSVWLVGRASAGDTQKLRAAQSQLEAEWAIQSVHPSSAEADSVTRDALQAALLGPQESPITTDAGSLSSKITATNPNFAAAIVDMLRGAGVGPGDVVAVAYTGSFPMLDVASVIAVEALDAEPVITSSVGASNWGATDPSFTILDIESLLFERGIIHHRSMAAAVGGSLRRATMSESGRALALEAIRRNSVDTIAQRGLRSDVEKHMQLYLEQAHDRPIKAFLNIGGGQVSTGGSTFRDQFAPGLELPDDALQNEGPGLLARMRQAGVPVIHIDQVAVLAETYQLPVAPAHTPAVGEGGPFRDTLRIRVAAGVAVALLVLAIFAARVLVLTPSTEDQFDPYFGTSGHSVKRRLASLI